MGTSSTLSDREATKINQPPKSFRLTSRTAAIGVTLIGFAVLSGWVFDITILRSLLPNLATMKGNTAIAFVLCGVSLWMYSIGGENISKISFGMLCALIVTMLSALTLSQDIFSWNSGIDQMFFDDTGISNTPGRMSPVTSFSFLLISIALVQIRRKSSLIQIIDQSLSLVTLLLSLLALVGYLYNVQSLYHVGPYSSVALHTAFSFAVLSIGVLCARTDRGLMAIFAGDNLGSIVLRRLLPYTTLFPIGIGWIRLWGEYQGLYNLEFGLSLMAISSVVVLTIVLVRNAAILNKIEINRKKTQSRLEKATEELDLYNNAPCGYHSLDLDGTFIQINETELRWLQYSRDELIEKKKMADLIMPKNQERFERLFDRFKETGTIGDFELELVRKDGSVMPVMFNALVIRNPDGGYVKSHFTLFDLTEQKEYQRSILEGNARFSKAFHSSPIGMVISRLPQGDFIDVNEKFLKIFGFQRNDVVGKSSLDLNLYAHPEERARAREMLVQNGMIDQFDAQMLTKSGSILDTIFSAVIVELNGVRHVISMIVDITDRKKAETALLDQTRKVEAANRELESFSYSISHDLKAPLRGIHGFADLLIRHARHTLDEKGLHYLDVISDSAKQMGILVNELLEFSRMGRKEMLKSKVRLDDIARRVIEILSHETAGRNIEWKLDTLPEVEADPSMMRLVFQNLLGNAVKYTRIRENAEIEIGSTMESEEVIVHIRDNGVGFDMEYGDKLFGVFQRLHRAEEFEGTGIGLANVRRIIERHNGRTWALGEVGKGAVFYFSLPK